MIRLFISHAYEDKDTFARPLANELQRTFDVWFDEYVLKLGDSLRDKIDEGLRSCDYGVVILSKAFFSKHWTRSELDGLFALESKNRKLILPVWHGVSESEVTAFSPILAGRLAAKSDRGVVSVAEEIRSAVTSSQRTKEISGLAEGKEAIRTLLRSLSEDEYEQKFLNSLEGVRAVSTSAQAILSRVIEDINSVSAEFESSRFRIESRDETSVCIHGPRGVSVATVFRKMYANRATDARFVVRFYLRRDYLDDDRNEDVTVEDHEWRPRCRDKDNVLWQLGDNSALRTVPQVADHLTESLSRIINEQSAEQDG